MISALAVSFPYNIISWTRKNTALRTVRAESCMYLGLVFARFAGPWKGGPVRLACTPKGLRAKPIPRKLSNPSSQKTFSCHVIVRTYAACTARMPADQNMIKESFNSCTLEIPLLALYGKVLNVFHRSSAFELYQI